MSPPPPLYVGIDLGTSGCRAIAITDDGAVAGEARAALPDPLRHGPSVEQEPRLWWAAVEAVMTDLLGQLPGGAIRALAVDGTSGTVLLTDSRGEPCGPALMYNDNRAVSEAVRIAAAAPPASAAHGTGSALAKVLWLLARQPANASRVATQADWITGRLCGGQGLSDSNNVLKLGWDPIEGCWPEWLMGLGVDRRLLPDVVAPGTPIGRLVPELAKRWGLAADTLVVAGTTDSTAAILATGAAEVGDAVTSLGSTLVTKVIGDEPVFAPEYGVYSQPLAGRWLIGGGSNSGGAVLRHFFTPAQMRELSRQIAVSQPTGLDYYPLLKPGERFPVNDPSLPPRLEPRPADDTLFFQGLLEGIAAIERSAYQRLAELGAPWPRRLFSVGGGAMNAPWTAIRAKLLQIPLATPTHAEAAYGSAVLARTGASRI